MLTRMAQEMKLLPSPRSLASQARRGFICAFNDHNKGYSKPKKPCPESGDSKGSDPEDAEKDPSKKPVDSLPGFNPEWKTYQGKKYLKPEYEWDFSKEECCPQCEAFRFDMHFYKPGNLNRSYQRTWWECTPRMVPKRVCCRCDAVPPEVERRKRQTSKQRKIAGPGCSLEDDKGNASSKGCSKFRMPSCRVSRIPPCCKIFPHPSICKKTKCPFPSYSECCQEDPAVIPDRPPECRCLEFVPVCIQLQRAKHMAQHNIALYPCERDGVKKKKKTT